MSEPQKPPPPRESPEQFLWLELSVTDIEYLLRNHWFRILIIPLLLAIVGFSMTKVMRPVFASQAVLYLRPNFIQDVQLVRTNSKLEDDDTLRSIESALVSNTIILNTIEKLQLRNDPSFLGLPAEEAADISDAALLRHIRDRYTTKLKSTTRLITLNVEDYSPERTVLIANTLVSEFLDHLQRDRDKKELSIRDKLVDQSDEALQNALVSEKKLEQFRSENPNLIVEQDSRVFQDRLLQHGTALNQAQAEASRLSGEKAAISDVDPELDPYQIFQTLKNRNSDYMSQLLAMDADAKADFAATREAYTPINPSYQSAERRVQEVYSNLQKYAVEMKKAVDSELLAAQSKVEELKANLDLLQGELVAHKMHSARFRGIKEEIDRNWNTYSKLQQKIMDLDLNPEITPTFVTILSDPVVPDKKAKPSGLLFAAGGGIFGVGLVLFSLLIRYRYGLPTEPDPEDQFQKLPAPLQIEHKSNQTPPLALESKRLQPAALHNSLAFQEIFDAVHSQSIIHVTSLHTPNIDIARILAEELGEAGHRVVILYVSTLPNRRETGIETTAHPNVFRLNIDVDTVSNEACLNQGIGKLCLDYSRIVIDTTRTNALLSKSKIAEISKKNLLVVAENPSPKEIYRSFIENLSMLSLDPVSVLHLSPDTSKHYLFPQRNDTATCR